MSARKRHTVHYDPVNVSREDEASEAVSTDLWRERTKGDD